MSDWSEIKKKINSTTKKIAKKTTEVADTASKHIKLKSLDGKLSDKYEELGRIYYKQLNGAEVEISKIDAILSEINALKYEKKALKAEIQADKERRAEEKNRATEEQAQSEETKDEAKEA